MRKNENSTKVIGRIYSIGEANGKKMLEEKVSGPRSKNPGTKFIAGVINVAVDEAGCNVIPVYFSYVTENYSKSGKPNPNYGVLKRIMTEGKTWVANGKDAATVVSIDGALGLNDFPTEENGETRWVSIKQNEGSFINILNSELPDENERSKFRCDMVITSITHVDANEEKDMPEYVSVRGTVFNFQDAILPCDFMVKNPQGIAYFDSLSDSVNGTNPLYTKVWGKINCETKTQTITEQSAFGEDAVRTYEKKTREWIITGIAKEEYDFGEEGVLTVEELTTAMQNRQVHLATVKANQDEYRASKAAETQTATPAATTIPQAKSGGFNF